MKVVEWRLLLTGKKDAFTNMAIDESIMKHVARGESPSTLRLYGWTPPAVSIGYFQGLEEEVNTKKCDELGVDYVRRITGGGAVFHEAEATYSFTTLEEDPLLPPGIQESCAAICGGIVQGLSEKGINAEFKPLNDVIVGSKKISGSAQTRRGGAVLQHGTLLLDVDVEKMFSVLKVPSEKIRDKMIATVKERVTSVRSVLGREQSLEEACGFLSKGFSKAFGFTLVEGKLSESELKLADEILKKRYTNKEWNYKR